MVCQHMYLAGNQRATKMLAGWSLKEQQELL